MSNELFVKASREKYRFNFKGLVSVEDLWGLSLPDLDKIAVALDDEVGKAGRKSFIGKRDTASAALNDKLEIVKYVIEVRLAEDEASRKRAEKRSQKEFLKDLLQRKQLQAMEGLSTADIEKQLAALADV